MSDSFSSSDSAFIYPPGTDTEFLKNTLIEKEADKLKNKIILEIGTGSGNIISIFDSIKNTLLATEVNSYALEDVRSKYSKRITLLQTNLFSCIDTSKVNITIFNPPYDAYEKFNCCNKEKESENVDKYEHNSDYKCQCQNCLTNYALHGGGINGDYIIMKFIENIKSEEFYILIIRRNKIENVNDSEYNLMNNNYFVKIINEKKVVGETMLILHGIRKN